jgi:glycosyltransferase involved in cell wall biosynthesis
MKLCFICCEYPPELHGGVGTFTQVIARALVQAGHEVRVIGVYPASAVALDYEDDQGVQVWRLRHPTRRGRWLAARYRMYQVVKDWATAAQVELVDAPDHEGWFAGWPRDFCVPLVLRAEGSYSYFAHEMGRRVPSLTFRLEKMSYRHADAWIATSRYIGEVTTRLFKLRPGPDATLFNPVDAPLSVGSFAARDHNRVVFSGTLTAKKGVIELIQAWPLIRDECDQAELHIYGKDGTAPGGGSMTHFLEGCLDPRLRGTVHFHGHVSRATLFQALSTARAAVLPSFAEGFALAPLEAMAYGCPTIYSRLGSGPELIIDGRDGLLVDPRVPPRIAEGVCQVLRDDSLARRLGEGGRARVLSAFALEVLLPRNEAFYSQLIDRFGGRCARSRAVSHAERV